MRPPCRVLFCDDRQSERRSFLRQIAEPLADLIECEVASSYGGLMRRIEAEERFDILVTDLNFDQIGGGTKEGLQIMRAGRNAWPRCELVIFTAYPNSLLPEEVMDASAIGLTLDTWVTKISDDPAESWERLRQVVRALTLAVEERRLREAGDDGELPLEAVIDRWAGLDIDALADGGAALEGCPGMVGVSKPSRRLAAQLRRVAPTQVSVLIYGQPGTGKELVARALHAASGREGEFIAVSCGEFNPELLTSELFGHLEGAFTGATSAREGLFAAADGGTLFLDEIGELPIDCQAQLLRVLEDGIVRPLGAQQGRRVDVRIVAATNRDLPTAARAGGFRADLLARLNRYFLFVHPLHQRKADIPPLALTALARLAPQYGRAARRLERDALDALSHRRWAGNVRELESVIARTLIELPPDRESIAAANLAASPRAAPLDAELWTQVKSGALCLTLSELAQQFGLPRTLTLVERAMLHFGGLPPEAEAQRLFKMSYRSWQHWAHYRGLTWEKVRARSS